MGEYSSGQDHSISDSFPPNDAQPSLIRRWLRHPLLHFLLIGIALFTVNSIRDSSQAIEGVQQRHIEFANVEHSDSYIPIAVLGQIITRELSSQMTATQTYLWLGVGHILTGGDHLLFLFALLLLAKGRLPAVAAVTAFTIAHSFTLTAAALGFVHVPHRPVAAAIALSVVFVSAEIICKRQGIPGVISRWPWLAVFVFGWLHGFGLADALSKLGPPQQSLSEALLFFNIGVELGLVLSICCILIVFAGARRIIHCVEALLPRWSWRVTPYAIGVAAILMFIQRIAAF